jgi:3'-phosphoadenosine 5'-phosphosulfate sulfotransferase (PAPS reductase)/FAD synthetase
MNARRHSKETMNRFPKNTSELLHDLKQETDTVLLAFSCGKDSLAVWCVLQDAGFKVLPYYKVQIPGLEFVENSLEHYEKHFNTKITRVTHQATYHWLNSLALQPPHRAQAISELELPKFDDTDIRKGLLRTLELPEATWTALGTRGAESPMRRFNFEKYGPYNPKIKTFAPIWNVKIDELIQILKTHQVKLPPEYAWIGRSFDGINHGFTNALKEHAPRDYERIKVFFPWLEFEFARWEVAKKHGQDKIR